MNCNQAGHAKLMFLLLTLSLEPLHAQVNTPGTLFARAIARGDLSAVETCLSLGINPDLPDQQTPVYFAVQFGRTQVVELLLAQHADPDAQIFSRRYAPTLLQYAAESGNLQLALMLAAAGAHIDLRDIRGRTALHLAIGGDHIDLIHFLLEKGADPNVRDVEGASPLDDAVWRGSLDAVAILLAHGARLNEPDAATGATPVNEAAFVGHAPIVEHLLQFHPDLGIPDKRGYSPLENAIRMGQDGSARLLLEAEPKEQKTPEFLAKTMEAAAPKDEPLVVEALLRQGAAPNGLLSSGATPLDEAALAGAIKVVRLLLDNSADPNLDGGNGATPLEDASLEGFDSIARLLLDQGALVNHVSSGSGGTALYAAASFGRGKVVKLLLDRGANPNLCNKDRKSPFQAAIDHGYNDVANQLKLHGGGSGCQ
jgi:ankyrin repeat protein